LTEAIGTNFPAVSLDEVAASFAKIPDSQAANANIAKLGSLVREEAAIGSTMFRNAEMWLRIKSPAISDGNNFGVDVQNYVLSELEKMRATMEGMVSGGKDYHWGRAAAIDKLFCDEKAETSSSESTEVEGDKTTAKKSSSTSKKSGKPAAYADYKAYLTEVDVKQYTTCFNQLTEIRNNYLRAHLLFSKNMKRLGDPRGEGEDGRSANVMSMF